MTWHYFDDQKKKIHANRTPERKFLLSRDARFIDEKVLYFIYLIVVKHSCEYIVAYAQI